MTELTVEIYIPNVKLLEPLLSKILIDYSMTRPLLGQPTILCEFQASSQQKEGQRFYKGFN